MAEYIVQEIIHEPSPTTSYAGFGDSTYKPCSVIRRSCLQFNQHTILINKLDTDTHSTQVDQLM